MSKCLSFFPHEFRANFCELWESAAPGWLVVKKKNDFSGSHDGKLTLPIVYFETSRRFVRTKILIGNDLQARIWSETYLREQFGCYVRPWEPFFSVKPTWNLILSSCLGGEEEWRFGETKRGESRGIALVSTASQDCCKKLILGNNRQDSEMLVLASVA